jgi:hypothetical protein
VGYWLTIEVFHAGNDAVMWRRAHARFLMEAALTNGAQDWEWIRTQWGVVLELDFIDEERRDAFRDLPAVRAALDAAPDPVNGVLIYPGRGGTSGARLPRGPRPAPFADAVEVPEPPPEETLRLLSEGLDLGK